MLNRAIEEDKMACTRELILFGKYKEFKKIIHKHVTIQEMTDDRELANLYSEIV